MNKDERRSAVLWILTTANDAAMRHLPKLNGEEEEEARELHGLVDRLLSSVGARNELPGPFHGDRYLLEKSVMGQKSASGGYVVSVPVV